MSVVARLLLFSVSLLYRTTGRGTQEFSDNCQDMPKHSEPKTEPVLNFVQPFHVDEVIRYLTHSIRGKRLISIIRYK